MRANRKRGALYRPAPGTIAERVLNYMRLFPVGTVFTSRDLMNGAGVDDDDVRSCLKQCVVNGLVLRQKVGHISQFSLTTESPPPDPDEVDMPWTPRQKGYGTKPPGDDLAAVFGIRKVAA